MWYWLAWGCTSATVAPPVEIGWVEGEITAIETVPSAMPITWVTLETDTGDVRFALPGTNGASTAIANVPLLHVQERWRVDLVEAKIGPTPHGLGLGMIPTGGQPRYALNGLTYANDALPRTFLLNEAGVPGLAFEDVELAAQSTMNAWTAVECATFEFAYGGSTALDTVDDGFNVLAWSDEWLFDPTIAGMTMTRFNVEGEEPIPDEADILFNADTYEWSLGPGDVYLGTPLLNFGSVVTHELGHVTGMDHEMSLVTSTMFYGYLGGDWMASLAGDDRRGLCENYPSGEDDCVDDADCIDRFGPTWGCVDIDGVQVCDDERDPVGADCSRTYINCEASCAFTNGQATEGYCTIPCEQPEDCPQGFTCGSADNVVFPEIEGSVCVPDESVDTDAADTDTADSPAVYDTDAEPVGCGCQTFGAEGGLPWIGAFLFARRRRHTPPKEKSCFA